MIVMRLMQGVGGAFIMANTAAILTDAFPPNQRGLALGTNMVAAIAGSFIGLVLGGLLGPIDWRLVFWVSVPVGVIGTVWGVINLKDKGVRNPAKIDWFGNVDLCRRLGLAPGRDRLRYRALRRPHHGLDEPVGPAPPSAGVAVLGAVRMDRDESQAPMFRISLFRIRTFAAGNVASLHRRSRSRRADVHPHHLASGHLAAQPWLQLRANPFVGGHLYAALDCRFPDGRAMSRATCRTASGRGPSPSAACSRPRSVLACWSCYRSTSLTSGSPC